MENVYISDTPKGLHSLLGGSTATACSAHSDGIGNDAHLRQFTQAIEHPGTEAIPGAEQQFTRRSRQILGEDGAFGKAARMVTAAARNEEASVAGATAVILRCCWR
jgi:hypothetical protein